MVTYRCVLVHAVVSASGQAPAEAAVSIATGFDGDLVAPGLYCRSVLLELLLGGVTKHMLDHMTTPLLVSL